MIVSRFTMVAKRGRVQELVALIKEERDRMRSEGTGKAAARIYAPMLGPHDVVAWEIEWESLAEYERVMAEWSALPETATLMEKVYKLTDSRGTTEIWTLAE